MKQRILSIISVVFLTAFVSAVNTSQVIANTDSTKSLSEEAKKLKVSNYNREANLLFHEGRIGDNSKYKEAIRKCEEAIKLDPNYADSYLLLGKIYSSMGQYDKADSFFDKAAALDRKLPEVELANVSTVTAALVSKYVKEWSWQKEVERAKKENANLRKMSPKERQKYEEKQKEISSKILISEKELDEAEKELGALDKGRTFLANDKYDKAIKEFKEVIKNNPNNASAYYWLGIAYSEKEDYTKMEDYSKANEAWDKAISIRPILNSRVNELREINHLHQSKTPEEKRAYQKWLKERKAEDALPADKRERLREERKKLEKARETEWEARKYYVDGRDALDDAWRNKNNKKYEEAITNFKKALELKPDYDYAILGIGDAYYSQKLYNQAMEEHKKVIAKNPKSINARIRLKRCYMKLKKYDEAKKECNIILKIDPNNTEAKECLKNLQSNKSQ